MSEGRTTGHAKLIAARKIIQENGIPKAHTATVRMKGGGQYEFKYSDLSDVLDAVVPALAENGLFLSHPVREGQVYAIVKDESGDVIESSSLPLNNPPADPQALGSLLTYYKRYMTYSVLGVHPDEDDEGTAAQEATTKKKPPFAADKAKGSQPAPTEPQTERDKAIRAASEWAGPSVDAPTVIRQCIEALNIEPAGDNGKLSDTQWVMIGSWVSEQQEAGRTFEDATQQTQETS